MKEKSLFLNFIGDTPLFRIIDFLIEHMGMDFSKTEIANGADISRTSLFKYWTVIEKNGIAKVTRCFGKTKLYTLDSKNPLVKTLLQLEIQLIEQSLNNCSKKEKKQLQEKKILLART